MQLSFIIALKFFTALAISAQAKPIELPTPPEARAPDANTDLFIYQHVNFGGQSYQWSTPHKTACVTVPGELQDDVSSLIIGGNINCRAYRFPGCAGTSLMPIYTGRGEQAGQYSNLGVNNDQISSFACNQY